MRRKSLVTSTAFYLISWLAVILNRFALQVEIMSLSPFNWSLITKVKETASIPPDVVFQIVENNQMYEVTAHKWVLAMVSPVFGKMFYTTDVGDKTALQIKVQQTTKSAFQILIDAAYNSKPIEDSLKGKSVPEVFDVVNLIERYEIEKLEGAILKCLSNYPITDDTVLEVAGEAMQYTRLFPRQAEHLLLACAKFLQPRLKDAMSIYKYAGGVGKDQTEVFTTLLASMRGIAPIECANCNNVQCKHGEGVKQDEFRLGLIVSSNMACHYWVNTDYGIGHIREINGDKVRVVTNKPGVTKKKFGKFLFRKSFDDVPLFLYSCK